MKMIIYTCLLLAGCSSREQTVFKLPAVNKDSSIKILLSGLPDEDELNNRNAVAKKYGFSYLQVAGCVVSNRLGDSILQENLKTFRLLDNRHGPGWRSRFEAALDSHRNRIR